MTVATAARDLTHALQARAAETAAPPIEVEELSKSFLLPHARQTTLKERLLHPFAPGADELLQALASVSFHVEKGECFGIIGKNGRFAMSRALQRGRAFRDTGRFAIASSERSIREQSSSRWRVPVRTNRGYPGPGRQYHRCGDWDD